MSRPNGTAGRAGHRWRQQRTAILTRDHHTCYLCGAHATTIDHITPLTRGGDPMNPTNLAACCRTCNLTKGTRTLEQHLTRTTQRPRW